MSNWFELKPREIAPVSLLKSFQLGGDAYKKYLQVVQSTVAAARVMQATLSPGTPNVLQAAVQAIVDVVEGFLQTGKVHVLAIPIGKTFPETANSGLPSTLNDVAEYFGIDPKVLTANVPDNAAKGYSHALASNTGNAGFLRTFTQSLLDVRDPNRPQYTQANDAVAMQVVLVGADAFSGAMEAASGLSRIFGLQGDRDLAARRLPIPQDLVAKVIGVPTDTRIGVRLDWKTPPAVFTSDYFPGNYTTAKRVAVIRSTDKRTPSKRSVLDLFTTQALTEGLESDDEDKAHKVIGIASGATTTWIDNDTLDATETYYYTLAWELEVNENSVLTILPFDKLSSVVKTQARKTTPTQSGTPPNWQSEESPIDAIPTLAQQSQVLLERLKAQTSRSSGSKALLSSALDSLTNNLDRQIKQISDLNSQLLLMSASFSVDLPQLYATTITGIGGNAKLIGELSARLFDLNDAARPPFDKNEYVIGVCIVAGGPRAVDISAVTDLFDMFFTPPRPTDPLAAVLDEIDAQVTAAEDKLFGADMAPLPYDEDGEVETADGPTPPADVDPLTGLPVEATLPVIASDGTPVATMDPENPNAGDTNAASCLPDPCSS